MQPTGTVTFLLSDLEGSTRLWEDHPSEMKVALERHDAILRQAIAGGAGYVFSTAGDAFAAAFATAAAAAGAAAAAQRALRAEPWPTAVALASRMGLHSGTADERDGDYFGPTVNRAARIMSAAHGGQVLVSAATATLLTGEGCELLELGRHRLRDLLASEDLHQLVVDGDSGRFPPPRTLERFDQNLPVARTALIGRDEEAALVEKHLSTPGVVTLTGMGGVGKTRLALEVAGRLLDSYEGVFFVDLGTLADDSLVEHAAAEALGLPGGESVGTGSASVVMRTLQRTRALLVLDNCEHLLDGVATLVEEITTRAPQTAVLATSREPLNVEGEFVRRVASLAAEASAALFRERAAAARPDIELADAEVDALCNHLDGIPLALELAASRLTHLSLSEITAHLDERFALLTGGRRRARQRHQTLQATMDWSYDLLDDEEKYVLRCCAVFAAAFAADTLQTITQLPSMVTLRHVGALVDKSLVVAQTDSAITTYRLLETVRIYAAEQLARGGEAESARDRLVEHLAVVAGSVAETFEVNIWPQTDSRMDRSNVIAALDWCTERGDLATLGRIAPMLLQGIDGSWLDEQGRYLGRDDVAACLDGGDLSKYLAVSAVNENMLGHFAGQEDLAGRALDAAITPVQIALAVNWLATSVAVTDPDEADRLLDDAARRGGPETASWVYKQRSYPAMMRGDLDSAVSILDSSRQSPRAAFFSAEGSCDLELLFHVLGRHDDVGATLAARPSHLDAPLFAFRAFIVRALMAAVTGDHDEALDELRAAARTVDRRPVRFLDRDILVTAAALAFLRGDPYRAAVLQSVERQSLWTRTPATWVLYKHYRDLVRASLAREDVQRAREEAAGLTIAQAIEEELTTRGDSVRR